MKRSSWKFVLLATFSLASGGSSAGAVTTIGVDFGTTGNLLTTTDSAGIFPQQNFNQAPGASGSVLNLLDSAGATTTTDISYSNFTGTFDFAGTSTPDHDLVNSGAYVRNSALTPVMTVTNIPYTLYDVVIYSTQGGTTRDSLFNIGAQNIFLRDTQAYPPFDQAAGTFSGDPAGDGNYVLFEGISGSSFTLNIQGLSGGGSLFQTAFGGFQILDQTPPAPEPSTALLCSLALIGSQVVRRRNQ